MGVEVRQLPMRDGGVEPELRVKAMSEIGPTTFEAGQDPHIAGRPVAELQAEQETVRAARGAKAKSKAK